MPDTPHAPNAPANDFGPRAPVRSAEDTAAKTKEAERQSRVARREERRFERQQREEERRQKNEQRKQADARRRADKAAEKQARLAAARIAPAAIDPVQNQPATTLSPLAGLAGNPLTDETSPPPANIDTPPDNDTAPAASSMPGWPVIGLIAAVALGMIGFLFRKR